MMKIIYWIINNWDELAMAIGMLWGGAEIIVRLTPTKKDDSFAERVGSWIRVLLDKAKVPNVKKKVKSPDA